MRKTAEQIYRYILLLSGLGIAFVTLGGYFGNSHFFFDLLSHFKIHLFLLSALLMLPVFMSKNKIITLLVFASLLANAYEVIPIYITGNHALADDGNQVIKILSANVKFNNDDTEDLLKLIKNEDPDVIYLQELNQKWISAIHPLNKFYPFNFIEDPGNEFGIAILSKTKLANKEIFNASEFKTPGLKATTIFDGQTIELITIHPNPPISEELFESRNLIFEKVSEVINQSEYPVVVGGDFNTTMWSPAYKKLLRTSDLKNTRIGNRVGGTWPMGKANYQNFINIKSGEKKGTDLIPRWVVEDHPIKLPIDHILVSKEIIVKNMTVGPNIGSDHLPIITEIIIPN